MEEKKRIVFILNPISGTHSKKEIPGLIDKLLDKEQFDYELRVTEYVKARFITATLCAACSSMVE